MSSKDQIYDPTFAHLVKIQRRDSGKLEVRAILDPHSVELSCCANSDRQPQLKEYVQ